MKASDPATAFRLPKAILASVDAICAKEDMTRSQIYRKSLVEYLRKQNAAIATANFNQPEPQTTWPMVLIERP